MSYNLKNYLLNMCNYGADKVTKLPLPHDTERVLVTSYEKNSICIIYKTIFINAYNIKKGLNNYLLYSNTVRLIVRENYVIFNI